jgi:hypothetical protein
MTPKEKSQELVSSFMSIKNIKLSDYSVIYLPAAKQCALIAVDEIIKHIETSYRNKDIIKGSKLYWHEVKQEIAKL